MLESGSSFCGYTLLAARCIYLLDFSDQENRESSLLFQRPDNSEYNNTKLQWDKLFIYLIISCKKNGPLVWLFNMESPLFFGIDQQYVNISNCVPVLVEFVLNL